MKNGRLKIDTFGLPHFAWNPAIIAFLHFKGRRHGQIQSECALRFAGWVHHWIREFRIDRNSEITA
jgi:hypothetical protein